MKETRLDEIRDLRFIVKMLVKNVTKILSRGFDIGKGIDVMTDLHREVISFTWFFFLITSVLPGLRWWKFKYIHLLMAPINGREG